MQNALIRLLVTLETLVRLLMQTAKQPALLEECISIDIMAPWRKGNLEHKVMFAEHSFAVAKQTPYQGRVRLINCFYQSDLRVKVLLTEKHLKEPSIWSFRSVKQVSDVSKPSRWKGSPFRNTWKMPRLVSSHSLFCGSFRFKYRSQELWSNSWKDFSCNRFK